MPGESHICRLIGNYSDRLSTNYNPTWVAGLDTDPPSWSDKGTEKSPDRPSPLLKLKLDYINMISICMILFWRRHHCKDRNFGLHGKSTCHLEWLLSGPWWESCESSDILQHEAGTNWGLNSSAILKKGDSCTNWLERPLSGPSIAEAELALILPGQFYNTGWMVTVNFKSS